MARTRRRRRSGLEDFATGFADTYGAFDEVARSIADTKMRRELKDEQANRQDTTTDVASGEDALAAAQQALQNRMATATTAEDAQKIQADFAPTIEALKARQATPAGVVHSIGTGTGFQQRDKAFSPEEITQSSMAAREGIYRKYGKDTEADALQRDALTRQALGLQIDEAKQNADFRTDTEKEVNEWNSSLVGPDGVAREATPQDSLRLAMRLAKNNAKHGKGSPLDMVSINEKAKTMKNEGHLRAVSYFHATGDAAGAEAIFNEYGDEKVKLDPASVKPTSMNIGGTKIPTYSVSGTTSDGKPFSIGNAYGALVQGLSYTDLAGLPFKAEDLAIKRRHAESAAVSANAAATNAASTAALRVVQTKSAKLALEQAKLGTSGEVAGKLLDDVRAQLGTNMKGGMLAGIDPDMTRKLDKVTDEAGKIINEHIKAGTLNSLNSASLYTEAVRRATGLPAGAKPGKWSIMPAK